MNKDQIIEQLKNRIADFKAEIKTQTTGRVVEVGDGIVRVSGLSDVMMSEMLAFRPKHEENGNEHGKNENEIKETIARHPEIDKVQVIFWPFWVKSVPSNLDKIKVKVN